MINFTKKIFLGFICMIHVVVFAQRNTDSQVVTFEEVYDVPYEINKFFFQFQPIYGEMFVANINAGLGFEVSSYLKDQFDFKISVRKTYARQFDVARDLSEKNSIFTADRSGIANVPRAYSFLEFGATYHIKDFEKDSETRMFLYKKSYKGDKWARRVPREANIPSKVRKVYGARLGGIFYNTTTDLKRAMDAQNVSFENLVTENGETFKEVITQSGVSVDDVSLFGNVDVAGIYVGGSIAWIHNIAVKFDNEYQLGRDDLILTAFADIIYAPSIYVHDIAYTQRNKVGDLTDYVFNADVLATNEIGFRLGLDGKFNRTIGWGYGAEVGYKPTLKRRGLYVLVKISFPIYSTNLDYQVETFGK